MTHGRWIRPVLIIGSVTGIGLVAVQHMREGDDPSPAHAGVVVVPGSVEPPATPPTPMTTSVAPQRLAPPEPPAIRDAVAAPPDAFVGQWRADGDRLTVARLSADHYEVVLAAGSGEERYDGVMRDGRVHFAHGIDGDWLQATASGPHCLYMGTGRRFCRAS